MEVAIEKRILNEFGSKILNEERLDKIVQARESKRLAEHLDMSFRCECDDDACIETILMSAEEYQRVHHKTKYFVVVPGHVAPDLEEVITSFSSYAQVAKFFPHPKAP